VNVPWYKSKKYQGLAAAILVGSGVSAFLLQQLDIWGRLFPPKPVGTYWIFVVDTSRKMFNQESGENKLPEIVEALEPLVRGVKETDQCSLLVFGHRGFPDEARACEDTEKLLKLGFWSRSKILEEAKRGTTGAKGTGKSCLGFAVDQAISEFQVTPKKNPNSFKTLVVIAGGASDCTDQFETLRRRLEPQKDLYVDLKLIGYKVNEAEYQNLQRFAELIQTALGKERVSVDLQTATNPPELKKAVHIIVSTEPFLKRREQLIKILDGVIQESNKMVAILNKERSKDTAEAGLSTKLDAQLEVARNHYRETDYQFRDLTQKDYREETRQIVQALQEMRRLQEQLLDTVADQIEAFSRDDRDRIEKALAKYEEIREQYNRRIDEDQQSVKHLSELER
jgi:hypothetical protein